MGYEKIYTLQEFTPDVAIGVKLPIVGKNGNLFDLSYSTEEQVLSNLKNLLLTNRGERIMQPFFGTDIRKSLFNQNTEELKEQIAIEISEAISFWLPYISIVDLNIQTVVATGPDLEEHGVTISLKVSINGQISETPITFLVTGTGAFEI
jgi:phage baseplate assembly protein W